MISLTFVFLVLIFIFYENQCQPILKLIEYLGLFFSYLTAIQNQKKNAIPSWILRTQHFTAIAVC